jgi:hypothetical protein
VINAGTPAQILFRFIVLIPILIFRNAMSVKMMMAA